MLEQSRLELRNEGMWLILLGQATLPLAVAQEPRRSRAFKCVKFPQDSELESVPRRDYQLELDSDPDTQTHTARVAYKM